MTNAYVSSVAYNAVVQWAASTAYTVGQYRRQLAAPTVDNERVFKCTTPGTSGGTEPAWTLTNNGTTNDGTVVWTQVAGQEANQSAGNWTAPHARIESARTVMSLTLGDFIFVSSDHAETKAAASLVCSGSAGTFVSVLSVTRLGTNLPPTSADLQAGATVSTTGANSITLSDFYGWGLIFRAGSGASAASINFSTVNAVTALENCSLVLNNTNASSSIAGSTSFKVNVLLKNTAMTFGAVGQSFKPGPGEYQWIDTPSAVLGLIPTTLILPGFSGNSSHGNLEIRGLDLSAVNTTIVSATSWCGRFLAVDCKLHPSATLTSGTGASSLLSSCKFHNCDDSTNGRNFRFYEQYLVGSVQSDVTLYRGGGASDGVTNCSHKIKQIAGVSGTASSPLSGPWVSKRINATGNPVTASIEVISSQATAPKDNQIWMDVEALATTGSPLSTRYSSRAADVLQPGTTLTASTQTWSDGVTTRANSTSYAVGDTVKLASNPGRVFFCATAGVSAASEPAGYASAVDGGLVTDGSTVFRAMWRQKVTVTFTPQIKGVAHARICMAFASASPLPTVYVDPKLTIA